MDVGETTFVIMMQAIIILTLSSLFLFFLFRSIQKRLNVCMTASSHVNTGSSFTDVEHYLTAGFCEPDWLFLRKNYLELEKGFLASKEREDFFWINLGNTMKVMAENAYLAKRMKIDKPDESEEEETKELKNMMIEQNNVFEELLAEIESDNCEIKIAPLKEKLIKLSRSHTELSHCIFVLEDENIFLREQIRGLLKLDS